MDTLTIWKVKNELSLDAAQIPFHLEPSDLYRLDGKRPDGASVVPLKEEER